MTYSIKEVAEMMNVEPSILRYYDSMGLLPGIKIVNGRKVFEDKEWYYTEAIKAGTEKIVENVT